MMNAGFWNSWFVLCSFVCHWSGKNAIIIQDIRKNMYNRKPTRTVLLIHFQHPMKTKENCNFGLGILNTKGPQYQHGNFQIK